MNHQTHRLPRFENKPPKEPLTHDQFEHLVQNQRQLRTQSRAEKEASQQNVQMSIRMPEADYLRFRALCVATRRTNGDMLSELMAVYLADLGA